MDEEEKTPTMWTEELLKKYLRVIELAEVDTTVLNERARDIVPTLEENPREGEG
jgi:hypothetical protein